MFGLAFIGQILKSAAILVGVNSINRALTPHSTSGGGGVPTPLKQSMPPKWSAYGPARRLNPPFALWEMAPSTGRAVDVLLIHEGKINGYTELWLNDDRGSATPDTAATSTDFGLGPSGFVRPRVGSDGRYGFNADRVRIFQTDGSDPGAHFDVIAAQFNDDTWDEDHRGDGIAMLALLCLHGDQSTFARVYPNGAPLLTCAIEGQLYWDPRDDSTGYGANLPLELLDYLTTGAGGLNIDYDNWIAPSIETWKDAADDADLAVDLKAGGTEPRYHGGGGYYHTDNPAETIAKFIRACDGRLLPAADGSLAFYSGRFVVPDITLTDRDIIRAGTSLFRFRPDETRVNELQVQFTDRSHQWNKTDAPAWRDEDDITDRGLRSEVLDLEYCQSAATAQRLAKRRFMRLNSDYYGTIMAGLYGFKAMGKPTVRLQCPDLAAELNIPALADMMFEIEDGRADYEGLTVSFDVLSAPDLVDGVSPLDAWDEDTEEATATSPRARPDILELTKPTISAAGVTASGVTKRVTLTVAAPAGLADVSPLTWFIAWRTGSSDPWSSSQEFPEVANSAPIYLTTGAVPQATLQFHAQYMTGDHRRSDWSDPFDVNASTATAVETSVASVSVIASSAQSTASAASSAATSAGTAASVADSKAVAVSAATSTVNSAVVVVSAAASNTATSVSAAFSSLATGSVADASIVGYISTFSTSVSSSLATNSAGVSAGVVAVASVGGALAAAATSLAAYTSTVEATAAAATTTETAARTTADTALTTAITSATTRISTQEVSASAGINSLATTQTTTSTATAAVTAGLAADISTAAVSATARLSIVEAVTADTNGRMVGLFGAYIDVDNVLSFFQLLEEGGGGTTISEFLVAADVLRLIDPVTGLDLFRVDGTGAYVAGARVETNSVQTNAITLPVSAFTAGITTVGNNTLASPVTVQSATITTDGKTVQITGSFNVNLSSATSNQYLEMTIKRDGTIIKGPEIVARTGGSNITERIVSPIFEDTPSAGSHTYTILIGRSSGGGSSDISDKYLNVREHLTE